MNKGTNHHDRQAYRLVPGSNEWNCGTVPPSRATFDEGLSRLFITVYPEGTQVDEPYAITPEPSARDSYPITDHANVNGQFVQAFAIMTIKKTIDN